MEIIIFIAGGLRWAKAASRFSILVRLEAQAVPRSSLRRRKVLQDGRKMVQDRPKTALDRPKTPKILRRSAQDAARRPQDSPKTAQDCSKTAQGDVRALLKRRKMLQDSVRSPQGPDK